MITPIIENTTSIEEISDWIELSLHFNESDTISKEEVLRTIEDTNEELDGDDNDAESYLDGFLLDIWNELRRRNALYENLMYDIRDNSITKIHESTEPHIMLLLLSLYGANQVGNGTKLFEYLSAEALKKYLSGEVYVLGWPVEGLSEDENNTKLGSMIKDICSKANERYIESPPARYNDRGVDVIGWKPFHDCRSGQIIYLMQCAAGKRGFFEKKAIPLGSWEEYAHWANKTNTAFSVPKIVKDNELWHDKTKELGIIFDRVRIIKLISHNDIDNELLNDIIKWNSNRLKEVCE